jgi:hypothetical protein
MSSANETLTDVCLNKLKLQCLLSNLHLLISDKLSYADSMDVLNELINHSETTPIFKTQTIFQNQNIADKLNSAIEELEKREKQRNDIKNEIFPYVAVKTSDRIDKFLRKFHGLKCMISAANSFVELKLKLLRDPRLPKLDFEIPKFIGMAEVIVEYVDLVIPKSDILEVPIGKFNDSKSCGDLNLKVDSYGLGLVKILTIKTGMQKVTTSFDGTCLRVYSSETYLPGSMKHLIACFTKVIIPIWIRTIEVKYEYRDPLA